jgi:hypothetical protein
MVDVEVRAKHQVDCLGRHPGSAKPGEPTGSRAAMPVWNCGAILVLADAGVDDDGASVELQNKALDGAAEPVAVDLDEFRLEPVALGRERGDVEPRQEPAERQLKVVIVDDCRNLDLADREAHPAALQLSPAIMTEIAACRDGQMRKWGDAPLDFDVAHVCAPKPLPSFGRHAPVFSDQAALSRNVEPEPERRRSTAVTRRWW